MAWRFPPYRVRAPQVVDVDDMNDNFFAIAEEAGGNLNEHNFASSAFTRDVVADDAGMRLYREIVVVDGSDPTVSPAPTPDPATAVVDLVEYGRWQSLVMVEFAGEGMLWMMGSLQASVGAGIQGARFGLRLNGVVVPESVLGSLDVGQDPPAPALGAAMGKGFNGEPMSSFVTGVTPVVVEAMAAVPEGNHTVEIVSYIGEGASGSRVFSRELIVVELRAHAR